MVVICSVIPEIREFNQLHTNDLLMVVNEPHSG